MAWDSAFPLAVAADWHCLLLKSSWKQDQGLNSWKRKSWIEEWCADRDAAVQESHGRAGVRDGSLIFKSLWFGVLGCGWLSGVSWDLPANVASELRQPVNSHVKPEVLHHPAAAGLLLTSCSQTEKEAQILRDQWADPGFLWTSKVLWKKFLKERWYER